MQKEIIFQLKDSLAYKGNGYAYSYYPVSDSPYFEKFLACQLFKQGVSLLPLHLKLSGSCKARISYMTEKTHVRKATEC